MIDYETYCKIHDHRTRQGLSIAQTAQALGLHPETVSKWSRIDHYRRPTPPKRGSRLDSYKGQIVRWLDTHPYSAQQIFQRLREAGFVGGVSIVKDYVRLIRPPKQKAFLKLAFAEGECAQVDWGEYGTIAVGQTRRKLSFFVMVLCYSRNAPHIQKRIEGGWESCQPYSIDERSVDYQSGAHAKTLHNYDGLCPARLAPKEFVMLQKYFASSKRIQALRDSPFGAALEGFALKLSDTRYARRTICGYIWAVEHFVHWTNRQNVPISSVDEAFVDRFGHHLRHCRCRGRRRSHRMEQIHCARVFLNHLRGTGLVITTAAESEGPVLVAFRRWMQQQRGTSERALENYSLPIRDLLKRLGEDPAQFDAHSVRQFVLQRRQRGEGAARTCTNALRAFFQFLSAEGRCSRDLVAAIPTIAHWQLATLPRYLQPEEVERVITAWDALSPVGRRNRAILLLLARLGLRAGDVVQLRLDDINWEEAWIQVCGKSRRQVRLPLSQEVGDALAAYLRHGRPDTEATAVFVRADAPFRALSHNTVSVIVDRTLRRAGIIRPSRGAAHLLRHSFATSLLRQGAALQDIGDILRHRSVTTTEIYAKVDFTVR